MSAPNNPQDLQVIAPQQQAQQPAQQPTPTPQQAPPAAPPPVVEPRPRVPMEDRILTPEETESLLRGVQPEPDAAEVDNAEDQEQAKMAREFFQELPSPTRAPELTPEQRAAMVATQAAPPPVPVQAVPQQQPAPVPVQSDMLAALQAQNQLLQTQIQEMQRTLQQQIAPQPQPQPQAQPQPTPGFQFNVPDNYMNALAADDVNVRRMALNGLLNGVAEEVTQRLRHDVEQRFQTVPLAVNAQLAEHTKRQRIQQDMFGTYPELQQHVQYVQAAAQQVAGNIGMEGWTADIRDAIAERVAPFVPGLAQKIQQNRAQRVSQQYAPQYVQQPAPQQQYVPQQQVQLPQAPVAQPPVGVHGQPIYVRDAAGNLVPYQPQQQFIASQQTRPAGRPVDAGVQDIWSTLGF